MGSRTEAILVRYITADGLVADTVERVRFFGAVPQEYIVRAVSLPIRWTVEPVDPVAEMPRRQYRLRSYDGWPYVHKAVYEEVVSG